MAIDPRAFLTMLMAGTGARTGDLGMQGLLPGPAGATSAPSAFATPARGQAMQPAGPQSFFPPMTPGLQGPIRRRMRHPRASHGARQIQPMVKSPILPGTAKGLATTKGA